MSNPSRRIIRQTDNLPKCKSEDEFWLIFVYIHLTRYANYTTGALVFSRGSLAIDQKQYGGTRWLCLFDFHLSCLKLLRQCFLNFFKYLYIWGLLLCQTFQYCSHPTVWSLPMYRGSNITSVSRSVQVNFVFPFFLEEAVALLNTILKKAFQETLWKYRSQSLSWGNIVKNLCTFPSRCKLRDGSSV